MKHYEPKSFSVPELKGISAKNIEEHIKLYQGYVKHTNLIIDKIAEYTATPELSEKYAYELGELQRRFSFEYNGMKNHEYYFQQLESSSDDASQSQDASNQKNSIDSGSAFGKKLIETFGSLERFIARMKAIALTRGIGWAILYRDLETDQLVTAWVDEQHLGQLNSAQFIFGIDMWEHAFVADYQPSGKKQYVEDYFGQVNWGVVAGRYS